MPSNNQTLGLRQVAPLGNTAHSTTIDIIAIHGLGTESPRTWLFNKKDGNPAVNWLADSNMLPAAIPEATIYTYDWNANYFQDAPVQTLLGHAENLLTLVAEMQGSESRPIIFVASCFGGLILAKAINRVAQEGSPYRQILRSTVGIVFLATPFRGSDASKQAQWQVVVGGVMGEQTSSQLVDDLNNRDKELRELTRTFAENARRESIGLPVHCFYETKETEMLRRVLSPGLAAKLSTGFTHKLLVTEESACLDTFPRNGLDATHSGMNKFDGPESADFKLVKGAIRKFGSDASSVLSRRKKSIQERHWTVPFGRNKDFVGRESILAQLLEKIPPSIDKEDCQRTAIEGLGGVGKTQISIEAAFCVRDKHPDCSVFWVPAVDATSFENSYRDIGHKLKIDGINDDKADTKLLVKNALSRDDAGSWLMIVDNADDKELFFGDINLSDYLPFSQKGSILFTTRNHKVVVGLDIPERNVITVTEMSRPEAVELLQRSLAESQTSDTESTESLLDFLGNLPLAIRQASAFMKENKITTAKYLHYCRSSNKTLIKLLSKKFKDRSRYEDIENAIATTWLISFEHISRDNHLAAKYLKFICFLAEKAIPVSLLPQADDELETEEAIGTLKAYAFITGREDPTLFDIHRLVRLAMRNWLASEGAQEGCITEVIQRLSEVFPFPKHENRDEWLRYLPHVQNALDAQVNSSNKEVDSGLLFHIAEGYNILGRYQEAVQMHRQALKLRKKVLGPEHPYTLSSMNNLANVLHSQGKYDEAEQMHRQALKLREKVLGPEHPDMLISMSSLANVLYSQGKDDEAEQMHRQALKLREKVLGPEHPDTLTSMSNLANVLDSQGKYDEAEQMHRQALKLREKVLGPEHPDTLTSMSNLANVLHGQGKYDEAEQMHRQALKLWEKVLGPEHPDTLISMNNLANVLHRQGKYDEAEQMLRQALELREKVLGPEHPDTLSSISSLANVLHSQGKYDEAEQMLRQALELREKVLGPEHPDTLSSISSLANVLHSQGKYDEAEQMYRQALKLREKVLGPEHPNTLISMSNLANMLYSQRKYDEAEQMNRQALKLWEKVLGPEHPDTLSSMSNLANVLYSQGKYNEAEQMNRQALKLREKVLGPEHPNTLISMSNLANMLYSQRKYDEAEQMNRQALKLWEKVLGPEHPDTLSSMSNLANVLYSQGKYNEAEQMNRQALKLREKVLGPEHPNTLSSMSNLANMLYSQRKYDEAEQMYRQALKLWEKVLGPEHPDTLSSMSNLANVLHSQRKYDEAEQMHRQALKLRKKVLGPEHPDTLTSMSNLASVLDSQG